MSVDDAQVQHWNEANDHAEDGAEPRPTGEVQRDDLACAEWTLNGYSGAPLVSDEAELLRGCLHALVAIGRALASEHACQHGTTCAGGGS